jgi:Xaa-Pro aminopeptidase
MHLILALGLAQAAEALPVLAAEEYAARRQELARRAEGRPVIVPCEELMGGEPGIDLNTPRYDFDYLVGWRAPGAVVVVTEEGSLLFSDAAPPSALGGSFARLLGRDALETFVGRVFEKGDAVLLNASGGRRELPVGQGVRRLLEARGVRIGRDSRELLSSMRAIKSEAERRIMRAVTRQTNAGQVAALKTLRPGINEGDLQKAIEAEFKKHGATGLGFPSIVGSGKNGTILHYMKNDQPIPDATLVVIDIGAGYQGYSSDVTRTIPSGGRFSPAQRQIYQCVLDALKAAEKILRPGVAWAELDDAARKVIEERGLTKWSYGHAQDPSVRHFLGHFVGLSVHDSGPYARPLEEGMCVTIEPGIYDKEQGFGVRIEDIYLITADGFERLSAGAPREIDEIEKVMGR